MIWIVYFGRGFCVAIMQCCILHIRMFSLLHQKNIFNRFGRLKILKKNNCWKNGWHLLKKAIDLIIGIRFRNLYLTLRNIVSADIVFPQSFKMNFKWSQEPCCKTTLKKWQLVVVIYTVAFRRGVFLRERWKALSLLVEKTTSTGITIEPGGTTDEFLKALRSWFHVRERNFIGKTFFLKTVKNPFVLQERSFKNHISNSEGATTTKLGQPVYLLQRNQWSTPF